MTVLSRGKAKRKNVASVRTKSVVAFMCCFSSLVSVWLLVRQSALDEAVHVPASTASWQDSFKQQNPAKVDVGTRNGGASPNVRGNANKIGAEATMKEVEVTTELCFVTSIYGHSANYSDRPHNVTDLQRKWFPESKFYIFTNMPDLEALGWIKVVRNFEFKRFITMSRWPKFLAWKEPMIQSCRVVFYMDGYVTPNPLFKKEILEIAKAVEQSESGMAQNEASTKHRLENHTLIDELKYIIRTEKDIMLNINNTAQWLRSQPDFRERNQCQVYDNCLIGYNPRNPRFQEATTYFWNLYASEEYTWRDQPFWCFTLNKLGIKPVPMGGSRHDYFEIMSMNKAPGKHKYDASHENSANVVPKEIIDEPMKVKRKRKKKLEKLSNKLDVYQM